MVYLIPLAVFLLAGTFSTIESVGKVDADARNVIVQMRSDFLNEIMLSFSKLGSASVMAVLFIIIATVLLIQRRMVQALWLFVSIAGGYGMNTLLKWMYARPRPSGDRLVDADGFSFPSGNAMIGASFYLMIFYYLSILLKKSWIMTLGAFVVILLGLSRVYLGVHFPLDIIGGFAAGTFIFLVCRAGYRSSLKGTYKADTHVDV